MRTVIYVRLSVHKGDLDPSTSPQGQEDACRAYCAAQGWEVADVVRDLNVSGSAKGLGLQRPGIQRLRELGAERVVFLKIDRIARNVRDFMKLADDFVLVSVRENLDMGSPMGRLVATVLAAFAEFEAETIAGRVRDARAIVDAQGRFPGGVVPYGYRVAPNPDGNGKILEPDPGEAVLWQTAVDDILNGRSLYWVTKSLNESGFRPRKGGYLSPTTVRETLVGESLVGKKAGVQLWEPAISVDSWARVRAVFDARKLPGGARRGKNTTRLKHVMICDGCGSRLWVKNDRGVLFARCGLRNNGGDCPAPASVRYDRLEELVLSDPELRARCENQLMVVREKDAADPVAIRAAEDALEAAQARLRAAVTDEEEADALAERRAARDALQALLDASGEWVERPTGETVWDVITSDDVDTAAEGFRAVVDNIAVKRGGRGKRGLDPARVTVTYWQ